MASRTRRPGSSVPREEDTQAPEDEELGETLAPYLRDPEDPEWLAFPTAVTDEDESPRRARSLPPMPFSAPSRISSGVNGLLDRVLSDGPFLWSERNHGDGALRRQVRLLPALALALLVVLAAGTFAWVLASKASSGANIQTPPAHATPAAPGGLVLQAPVVPSPTPKAPNYLIGAWLAQTSPTGGATQVFVRVSHDSTPVAGVPVSITISFGDGSTNYGPTRTDTYGVATFNVFLGAGAGTPGYLAANASVGGQSLSFGQAFVMGAYAPAPAAGSPSPTDG